MNVYGQLIKSQLENLSADPATPSDGLIYWNTTIFAPRIYDVNSATWKTISLGSSSVPNMNVRASEGGGTVTLTAADNPNQKFDLIAAETLVLPTTTISKGDLWKISNPNPWTLTIQASDASNIIKVWGAEVVLIALINTPVTNTDWAVVDKSILYGSSNTDYVATISAGSSVSTQKVRWIRAGIDEITIFGDIKFAGGAGSNALSVSFPSGFSLSATDYPDGDGVCIGSCSFSVTGKQYCGFVSWSGVGTATDMTFFSGYTAGTSGGNEVAQILEGYPATNSVLSFEATVKIQELAEV